MSTTMGRAQDARAQGDGRSTRPPAFTIMNTLAGRPAWWLHAAGGYLVAWSGAPLDSDDAAREAAEAFRARAEESRFEVYVDAGGKFRWRAWSRAVRVAESGEWFVSRSEA
ncbi:MAG: hypothetical protein EON52_22825, partial [Actinomycetales bacterium]